MIWAKCSECDDVGHWEDPGPSGATHACDHCDGAGGHWVQEEEKMVEGNWIDWSGGEMPVAGNQLVRVRTRDGRESPLLWAQELTWQHGLLPDSEGDDIVAYSFSK